MGCLYIHDFHLFDIKKHLVNDKVRQNLDTLSSPNNHHLLRGYPRFPPFSTKNSLCKFDKTDKTILFLASSWDGQSCSRETFMSWHKSLVEWPPPKCHRISLKKRDLSEWKKYLLLSQPLQCGKWDRNDC